jgi:hypothetical protein
MANQSWGFASDPEAKPTLLYTSTLRMEFWAPPKCLIVFGSANAEGVE